MCDDTGDGEHAALKHQQLLQRMKQDSAYEGELSNTSSASREGFSPRAGNGSVAWMGNPWMLDRADMLSGNMHSCASNLGMRLRARLALGLLS